MCVIDRVGVSNRYICQRFSIYNMYIYIYAIDGMCAVYCTIFHVVYSIFICCNCDTLGMEVTASATGSDALQYRGEVGWQRSVVIYRRF